MLQNCGVQYVRTPDKLVLRNEKASVIHMEKQVFLSYCPHSTYVHLACITYIHQGFLGGISPLLKAALPPENSLSSVFVQI